MEEQTTNEQVSEVEESTLDEGTQDAQTDAQTYQVADETATSKEDRELSKVRRQAAKRRVMLKEVAAERDALKERLRSLETGTEQTQTEKQLHDAQKRIEVLERRSSVVSSVAAEATRHSVPVEFVMESISDDDLYEADDALLRELVADAADTFAAICKDHGYVKASEVQMDSQVPRIDKVAPPQAKSSEMDTTGTTAPVSSATTLRNRLDDAWRALAEAKTTGDRRTIRQREAQFNAERADVKRQDGGGKVYSDFCQSLKL